MRGWRGGAAALLVAAVLLPAPLLLTRRAAAPADEWRRADVGRADDRALAGADDTTSLERAIQQYEAQQSAAPFTEATSHVSKWSS